MAKTDPVDPAAQERIMQEELSRRVARYRERLIAEGRMNAVRSLDKAIAQSGDKGRAQTKGSQ